MKKIILSIATMATLSLASTPVEIEEPTKAVESKTIFDRVHAKGDLRLRYELIERDDKADKYRERFRLRYSINVDITDNLTLQTALSSGKGNPTSGNVTFKDDENLADYFVDVLKLDIFNLKYKFDNSWINIGKGKHHIYRPIKTQLIWDNDIRLEGVNYGYKDDTRSYRVGVNKLHRLENEASSNDDIYIYLAQYVQTMKLDNSKLNFGGGFYYYDGVKGNSTPYEKGALGNSLDSKGLYLNDYSIVEAFAEFKMGSLFGKPFKIAGTVAYNASADNDNLAYDISMQLGDTKNINDWKIGYTYRDIEKDAVFAAHNDSDFIAGGTDGKGHIITAKYKFAKNIDLGGHFQWATLNEDKSKTGVESDYHRVQLDVILKF
ncbi:Outer membrane receptor for ferric coprogen and ferric-rhodotorulic acid [hydrothermal vent metagenome]|uniref:Outer membrane receptor for ferric coprogen and ferric-rhodotorulic acid n=1 Tax=hydrothermal vent metagenome TaxID=652676 RepID=A0A1W1EHX1_9ZZZZ